MTTKTVNKHLFVWLGSFLFGGFGVEQSGGLEGTPPGKSPFTPHIRKDTVRAGGSFTLANTSSQTAEAEYKRVVSKLPEPES